jgi:hypothetical protein
MLTGDTADGRRSSRSVGVKARSWVDKTEKIAARLVKMVARARDPGWTDSGRAPSWLDPRGRCSRRPLNRPLPPSGSRPKIPAAGDGGRARADLEVGGRARMQPDGEGAALVGGEAASKRREGTAKEQEGLPAWSVVVSGHTHLFKAEAGC